jgi:hypothetical protein
MAFVVHQSQRGNTDSVSQSKKVSIAFRVLHCVMLLRRDNIGVESVFEPHGGPFVLRSEVQIVDDADIAA